MSGTPPFTSLRSWLRAALVLPLLVAFGCDGDTTAPSTPEVDDSGVVRISASANATAFEFRSSNSGDPGANARGPFLVRGSNIRYDDSVGALAIDLTLTNVGERDLPYPGTLTLVGLLPDDLTVLDSDNGESGIGASFEFEFAEDDLRWNVDEESLPRTLRFVVAPGTSIGFVARVEAGDDELGGSIGGMVFEDFDQDGMLGPNENGIAGAVVELSGNGMRLRRTETGADGSYSFDGLPAGFYTVTKPARPFVAPTTPTTLQVILVQDENGVSDFLAANFGCLFAPDPPSEVVLEEGDRVSVIGRYADEPHRLIAKAIEVRSSELDSNLPERHYMELRGPLTDIDVERRRVWIMGTEIALVSRDSMESKDNGEFPTCQDRTLADLEIGEGVRAWVIDSDDLDGDDALIGVRFGCWRGEPHMAKGYVESIEVDADGTQTAFVVAQTRIIITADTWIGREDDKPDHHD